jgi:hypothetical protein
MPIKAVTARDAARVALVVRDLVFIAYASSLLSSPHRPRTGGRFSWITDGEEVGHLSGSRAGPLYANGAHERQPRVSGVEAALS